MSERNRRVTPLFDFDLLLSYIYIYTFYYFLYVLPFVLAPFSLSLCPIDLAYEMTQKVREDERSGRCNPKKGSALSPCRRSIYRGKTGKADDERIRKLKEELWLQVEGSRVPRGIRICLGRFDWDLFLLLVG